VPLAFPFSLYYEHFAQFFAIGNVLVFVLEMPDLLQTANLFTLRTSLRLSSLQIHDLRRGTSAEDSTDQGVFHSLRR
jgi:hypothetical protein